MRPSLTNAHVEKMLPGRYLGVWLLRHECEVILVGCNVKILVKTVLAMLLSLRLSKRQDVKPMIGRYTIEAGLQCSSRCQKQSQYCQLGPSCTTDASPGMAHLDRPRCFIVTCALLNTRHQAGTSYLLVAMVGCISHPLAVLFSLPDVVPHGISHAGLHLHHTAGPNVIEHTWQADQAVLRGGGPGGNSRASSAAAAANMSAPVTQVASGLSQR